MLLLLLSSRVLIGQGPCDSLTTYEEMPLPPAVECGAHDLHVGSGSGGHDNASDAFPTQTVVSGLTILVAGTFTIDKNITFENCILFFNENAELVTTGVVDLVGLGTEFYPCDNAWNGIRINADGAFDWTIASSEEHGAGLISNETTGLLCPCFILTDFSSVNTVLQRWNR